MERKSIVIIQSPAYVCISRTPIGQAGETINPGCRRATRARICYRSLARGHWPPLPGRCATPSSRRPPPSRQCCGWRSGPRCFLPQPASAARSRAAWPNGCQYVGGRFDGANLCPARQRSAEAVRLQSGCLQNSPANRHFRWGHASASWRLPHQPSPPASRGRARTTDRCRGSSGR